MIPFPFIKLNNDYKLSGDYSYICDNLPSDTEYYSPFIALKNGEVFTTTFYVGKSFGIYLRIKGKDYNCYNKWVFENRPATLGGYKILHPDNVNFSNLLEKEIAYKKQCLRGLELVQHRINSLINLRDSHPELFI